MNKKTFMGHFDRFSDQCFVLYTDLKQTPLTEILKAAHGLMFVL